MPLPVKRIMTICLLIIALFKNSISAQNYPNVPKVLSKDIIGVWQLGTPIVGAYLGEYFQFFKNGTFIYHYAPDDDTRNIIQLKGSYLFKDNEFYFTIKSKTVMIGGKIVAGAVGSDSNLFVFANDSTKVIAEKNPKQLDPLVIMGEKRTVKIFMIKINNQDYYKLSSNPTKYDDN